MGAVARPVGQCRKQWRRHHAQEHRCRENDRYLLGIKTVCLQPQRKVWQMYPERHEKREEDQAHAQLEMTRLDELFG
jgi:ribosomal protein L34E